MEQLRQNINHIVSRRAIHPAWQGIVEMENHPDGQPIPHVYRKMYTRRD